MEYYDFIKFTVEALLQEHHAISQEKCLHKESIRKIHIYIGSLITAGISLLAIVGLPIEINQNDPTKFLVAAQVLLAAVIPAILMVLAYLLNDLYQVYVMASQISGIERKINKLLDTPQMKIPTGMCWESEVTPILFGGKPLPFQVGQFSKNKKLIRPAMGGDIISVVFAVPLLGLSLYDTFRWLFSIYPLFACIYLVLFLSALMTLLHYGVFLFKATRHSGPLEELFDYIHGIKADGD